MKKITFLIGAGASALGVPVVNELGEKLRTFTNTFNKSAAASTDEGIQFNSQTSTLRMVKEELIEELKELILQESKHATIDTYAKKLWITGKEDALRKLKRAFSFFLSAHQLLNDPDPRYDSFFAGILEENSDLPKEVNIVSWNYDYQLEISLEEYFEKGEIEKTAEALNLQMKNMNPSDLLKDKSSIIKLNGSAGFFTDNKSRKHRYFFDSKNGNQLDSLNDMVRLYGTAKYNKNIQSSLSFAWEKEMSSNLTVQKAADIINNTDILVVIGYSFPYFNRKIDKFIFSGVTKLERVYLQDKRANEVEERFRQTVPFDINIQGIPKIIHVTELNEFYLPPEL